jgi:hypothetical protein
MADTPPPSATEEEVRDLVTSLLHGAMQASHALDQLEKLARHPPTSDPTALHQVTEAITTMARVRSALIHNADRLTDEFPTP